MKFNEDDKHSHFCIELPIIEEISPVLTKYFFGRMLNDDDFINDVINKIPSYKSRIKNMAECLFREQYFHDNNDIEKSWVELSKLNRKIRENSSILDKYKKIAKNIIKKEITKKDCFSTIRECHNKYNKGSIKKILGIDK